MKPGTKTAIRTALFALGFRITRKTDPAELLGLIQRLRPVDCGKDLIRLGERGDGGYLIPDDLEGIEYCFSPGVNTASHFENDLADRGIKSYLADFSVDYPPINRPEITFDKMFLGASDGKNYFTLSTWKEKHLKDYAGDMLLQMDIEGSEYEVILSLPDRLLEQFRIVVIEFHYLHYMVFDPFVFQIFSSCFDKLLRSFHVAHIHPNNHDGSLKWGDIEVPQTMEFTFFNRKRVSHIEPQVVFPHKLDAMNVPGADFVLPRCWCDAPSLSR